jgi:hypothetical protein
MLGALLRPLFRQFHDGVLGSSYAPHSSNKRVCVCRMFTLGEETRGRRLGRVARGTMGWFSEEKGLSKRALAEAVRISALLRCHTGATP